MSNPRTLEDSHSVISSPVSAGGPTPLDSRVGPTTAPCGQVRARVNLSASQVKENPLTTNDTSGPKCIDLFGSAALQRSLASRLQAHLGASGSLEYSLTWKSWPMPWREPICALRASGKNAGLITRLKRLCWKGFLTFVKEARGGESFLITSRQKSLKRLAKALYLRPISANAFFGWPSPGAADGEKGPEGAKTRKARGAGGPNIVTVAQSMAGYHTPRANDAEKRGRISPDPRNGLPGQAPQVGGWATPAAQEAGGTPEQFLERKRKSVAKGNSLGVSLTSLNLQAQTVAGYPTPNTPNGGRVTPPGTTTTGRTPDGKKRQVDLQYVARHLGQTPFSPPAPTEKRGALNPALSRWLMGYPEEWDSCGGMAMLLCRKSRRNS